MTLAAVAPRSRLGAGLGFALVSATTFGLSGALARGLLDSGWSAPAPRSPRGSPSPPLVLVVPGVLALRGRWHLLRRNGGLVAAYGVAAVAGAQLCYFYAVTHLQVGVALLIEYTAPVAVVAVAVAAPWPPPAPADAWPGAAIAAVGLVLVLDVVSGADLEPGRRRLGASARWWARRRTSSSRPTRTTACRGISLAAGGLVVGGDRAGRGRAGGGAADARQRRARSPTRASRSPGGCRSWRSAWSPPPSPT